jgi:ADP-ribosylglycohydrolase
VVAHSRLTHGDPIALAACAAMAVGMVGAMNGSELEPLLSSMSEAAGRYSVITAQMIEEAVDQALAGIEPDPVLSGLLGWAAHEAIAAAAYVVARHYDDARAAILEGANTQGDSDSIATLAGALVGARVGIGAIPQDWVRQVERSDELQDLASTAV